MIGSKAPELKEIRDHAKAEMKTLMDKLESVKKEIDDGCKELVNKMNDRVSNMNVTKTKQNSAEQ